MNHKFAIMTVLISLGIFTGHVDCHWDLTIPMGYAEDANLTHLIVRTLLETGWIFENPKLGAPYSLMLFDYPGTDLLHLLMAHGLSLISNDSAVVMNLIYLLTFILNPLAFYYVMTHLKVRPALAMMLALVFNYAPYHFIKGPTAPFLSAYFVIPLTTLLFLALWSDRLPFFKALGEGQHRFQLWSKASFGWFGVCFLTGASGVYYAFYSVIFILASTVFRQIRGFQPAALISGILATGVVSVTTVAQVVPSFIYKYFHGPNLEVAQRTIHDTEIYSLRMAQLLVPHPGGLLSFDWLDSLYQKFWQSGILINENISSSLGIIGSLGFLLLMVTLIKRVKHPVLDQLSLLSLTALLFASVSGGATLFTIYVTPQMRSNARISIFITMFALTGLGLWLEFMLRKSHHPRWKVAALVLMGALGIMTQLPREVTYRESSFLLDRAFVRSIEAIVPEEAMIFQLPYQPFPESPPQFDHKDYDHARLYFHSDHLRWSYGAMKGRDDLWQRDLIREPAATMVHQLRALGFRGLVIDRFGYENRGQDILAEVAGSQVSRYFMSHDQRYVFFEIPQKSLKNQVKTNEQAAWQHRF